MFFKNPNSPRPKSLHFTTYSTAHMDHNLATAEKDVRNIFFFLWICFVNFEISSVVRVRYILCILRYMLDNIFRLGAGRAGEASASSRSTRRARRMDWFFSFLQPKSFNTPSSISMVSRDVLVAFLTTFKKKEDLKVLLL